MSEEAHQSTTEKSGRWVPSEFLSPHANVYGILQRGWTKTGEVIYDMEPSHYPLYWRPDFDHSRGLEYLIPED